MAGTWEDREAIRELIARYCFHFDNGEFEEWIHLFTEDGAFDLGARGRFAGRSALREFLTVVPLVDGRPPMRHFVTNIILHVADDTATALSYVLVVGAADVPTVNVAGRYDDRLAKIDGTWRFTERRVYFDLMAVR